MKLAGTDEGAGIAFRDLYVSRNGKGYRPWRLRTTGRKESYAAKRPGAYAFLSIATDGAGYVEESAEGLWDAIVKGVKGTKSGALSISFDKRAAKRSGIKSLQVSVDRRKRGKRGRVPGKIGLGRVRPGGHDIRLSARLKGGGKAAVKDTRTVASCR